MIQITIHIEVRTSRELLDFRLDFTYYWPVQGEISDRITRALLSNSIAHEHNINMDATKRPLTIPPEISNYAEKHGIFDLYKVLISVSRFL